MSDLAPLTTPSQTVGPFFHIGMGWLPAPKGDIPLFGGVFDGGGQGVPDAALELWSPGWFARCLTDEHGRYGCRTIKPPATGTQAPHLEVSLFARGLLQRAVTRLYFPDETAANEADQLLAQIEPDRRATLLARVADGGLRFDIQLQGPTETVFFAW